VGSRRSGLLRKRLKKASGDTRTQNGHQVRSHLGEIWQKDDPRWRRRDAAPHTASLSNNTNNHNNKAYNKPRRQNVGESDQRRRMPLNIRVPVRARSKDCAHAAVFAGRRTLARAGCPPGRKPRKARERAQREAQPKPTSQD
jgi:hypothetical protein